MVRQEPSHFKTREDAEKKPLNGANGSQQLTSRTESAEKSVIGSRSTSLERGRHYFRGTSCLLTSRGVV